MSLIRRVAVRMITDAVREDKAQQERNSKSAKSSDLLQAKENELNSYLSSIGCNDIYLYDMMAVDNGTVSSEMRKMDKIRKDVEEYIALGGDPQVIFDINCLERRIGVLKYLRKIGQIERQYEFLDDNKYSVEDKIKAEQEALAEQAATLREEQHLIDQTDLEEIIGGDIDTLSGIDFERVCQSLVKKMGFETETTKATGDGGIDIVAYNHQPLLSGKYVIQCKRYSGSVGEPIIRDLYGVVMAERANKGIVITTGHFTRSAEAFAQGKPIELIGGIQLKDLLLQYGLYNEDSVAVTSNKAMQTRFDPKVCMGYYYDDYIAAKKAVKREPGDIKSRCAVITAIVTTIRMRTGLYDCGDKGKYEISYSDLQGMISLLNENLYPLIRQDNSQSPNKRLRYIYYTCLLIYAEYAALSGDFENAVDVFSKALIEWPELQEEKVSQLDILHSLFAIFNIIDCHELIDLYADKYHELLSDMKTFFSRETEWEFEQVHNAKQMKLLNNPHGVTTIMTFSADGLYDNCISEWGDFKISHGAISYRIDREHARIMLFSENNWTKKSKDVVILDNLSSYADFHRDAVRQIAKNYIGIDTQK